MAKSHDLELFALLGIKSSSDIPDGCFGAHVEKNKLILDMFLSGSDYVSIGKSVGLSGSRVAQLVWTISRKCRVMDRYVKKNDFMSMKLFDVMKENRYDASGLNLSETKSMCRDFALFYKLKGLNAISGLGGKTRDELLDIADLDKIDLMQEKTTGACFGYVVPIDVWRNLKEIAKNNRIE
jgi:hypothetical protein